MSDAYRLKTGILADLRHKHHLTEVQLAERLDCSRSTLHRIGSGEQPPSLNFIFKLVAAFGVSIYDAVENAPQPTAQPADSLAG